MRNCSSLVQALCYVASEEYASCATAVPACRRVVSSVCCLIADLTLHADSRAWVVEWGWLQIVVEVLKTATSDELRSMVGVALYAGLVTVLLDSDTSSKLRAMGARDTLWPYKEKIQKLDPNLWDNLCETILSDTSPEAGKFDAALRKHTEFLLVGMRDLPTLCSWDGCTAGEEEHPAGSRFKECASCGLAAYCRWEGLTQKSNDHAVNNE